MSARVERSTRFEHFAKITKISEKNMLQVPADEMEALSTSKLLKYLINLLAY